ncbi:winged helix-turn-helix domain-containing protein [Enterobacter asburiae]|uniref:winged helix-turn-helix domain-containing protein n=1 Tax=Enterobacter cloacae complex TaxID=354276 RepID=UPI001882CBFC|nr:winged helix-turn-helix domain-containing protein [Enterobacter asburiae]MBG0653654.1 winged helix-turn-helix domain-containing protein [Enterobacter asburiae]QOV81188.1 winged helix-turn-helix domain-containing protein [Enterobacter asburiae]HCM9322021.1 winged helix-turn-helix domain-containing protein [Enterobacter roggenkampii]
MALIPISNKITFDNVNRVLLSSHDADIKQKIGLPAVYCLECLIAANGEPVSQEKLIFEGWRRHGIEVSSDSVRRVISQIRKAIKDLNESPDILITLPKVGYRLIISIDNKECEINTEHSITREPENTLTVLQPEELGKETHFLKKKQFKAYVLLLSALSINIIIVILVLFPRFFNSPAVIHYAEYNSGNYGNKHIMVTEHPGSDIFISKELNTLEKSPFWGSDKNKYSWIYINRTNNEKSHNYFLCDKKIVNKDVKCVVRIILEK